MSSMSCSKVAALLVVSKKILKVIGRDDDVQAAYGCETKLVRADARTVDLFPRANSVGLARRLDSLAELS